MGTKKTTVKILRVTARPDKFRRAGFEFTQEPRDLLLKDLSKEQIAALKEEPKLVVIEAEAEVDDEAEVVDKDAKK